MQLAFACAVAAAAPAAATTFVRMDAPQLAARSDAAVLATVTAVGSVTLENGAAVTRVALAPDQVMLGALPSGPLVLDEPGGRVGATGERVFGAPDYRPGERVLVFIQRTAGGTLRTTGMAMGKYDVGAGGETTRRFDDALMLDPVDGAPRPAAPLVERLADVVAALSGKAVRRVAPRMLAARVPAPPGAVFTYFGTPSRWFEPDAGQPLRFLIDDRDAAGLGREVATGAAVDGLAAWSSVEGSSLLLEDASLAAPVPFAGCEGDNRLVFDDPFDEIDDPVDCRGVLGIGGYCYTDESRTVGGREFKRIRLGKAAIADGWDGCPQWTPCNLAEVVTHELGHSIGLGHSPDENATMAGRARFDGRCAGLAADDVAGVRALYPVPDTPTPTPSATAPPSAIPTATATATATAAPPTRTPPPLGARGVRGRITYYGSDLPVPGVRVRLRGSGAALAVSQGGGDYRVDELAAGDWTVEPRRGGEPASGAVTALDAAFVLQVSAGQRLLDAEHRVACDVTGNGSVSPFDAARILQVAIGKLTSFPAADLCGSDFVFFPRPTQTAGVAPIAPGFGLGGCRAGAISYAPLVGQRAGQNFRAALIGDCSGNWQPAEARGAQPAPAPEGTALVVRPLRRLPGGRWRLAIGLRTPATANALEIELRYDGTRLAFRRARTAHLGHAALIDAVGTPPGRLRVALASAIPLPADGRAVAVVDFTGAGAGISAGSVHAWSATLDDRLVSVPR